MQIDVSPYCHENASGTAELASTRLQVTFVCCDQTLCNSSDFFSRDHIPHLGMRFTRRGRKRAIRLAGRTSSRRENARRGRLRSRPSRIRRKCPLVTAPFAPADGEHRNCRASVSDANLGRCFAETPYKFRPSSVEAKKEPRGSALTL